MPQNDIKTDGFWLYGAGDYKNSWDSRYFGARPIQEIHSVLRAIWIKDNNSEVTHV